MGEKIRTHTNTFTKGQVEALRSNSYVKSVTKSTVRFTEEFKRYFYSQIKSGKTSSQIFLECGIDPEVLGTSRITGFRYTLNKQAKRESGFADLRQYNRYQGASACSETTEARLKRLEHELAYTRQEVEFLKKLRLADMEAQRQWESKHQPK